MAANGYIEKSLISIIDFFAAMVYSWIIPVAQLVLNLLIKGLLQLSIMITDWSFSSDNINEGLFYFTTLKGFSEVIGYAQNIALVVTAILCISHLMWDVVLQNNPQTDPILLLLKGAFVALLIQLIPDITSIIISFGVEFTSEISSISAVAIADTLLSIDGSEIVSLSAVKLFNTFVSVVMMVIILLRVIGTSIGFILKIAKRGVRLYFEMILLIITAPDLVYGSTATFMSSFMSIISIALETGFQVLAMGGFMGIVSARVATVFNEGPSLGYAFSTIILLSAWSWGAKYSSDWLREKLLTFGEGNKGSSMATKIMGEGAKGVAKAFMSK